MMYQIAVQSTYPVFNWLLHTITGKNASIMARFCSFTLAEIRTPEENIPMAQFILSLFALNVAIAEGLFLLVILGSLLLLVVGEHHSPEVQRQD